MVEVVLLTYSMYVVYSLDTVAFPVIGKTRATNILEQEMVMLV